MMRRQWSFSTRAGCPNAKKSQPVNLPRALASKPVRPSFSIRRHSALRRSRGRRYANNRPAAKRRNQSGASSTTSRARPTNGREAGFANISALADRKTAPHFTSIGIDPHVPVLRKTNGIEKRAKGYAVRLRKGGIIGRGHSALGQSTGAHDAGTRRAVTASAGCGDRGATERCRLHRTEKRDLRRLDRVDQYQRTRPAGPSGRTTRGRRRGQRDSFRQARGPVQQRTSRAYRGNLQRRSWLRPVGAIARTRRYLGYHGERDQPDLHRGERQSSADEYPLPG